ncbi:MAG: hypothetical protein HQL15_04700 [Candidatus Omnitrophica bacterium]|nr:hypothetical protein [Candidatus Omnitrophota bacterium]
MVFQQALDVVLMQKDDHRPIVKDLEVLDGLLFKQTNANKWDENFSRIRNQQEHLNPDLKEYLIFLERLRADEDAWDYLGDRGKSLFTISSKFVQK